MVTQSFKKCTDYNLEGFDLIKIKLHYFYSLQLIGTSVVGTKMKFTHYIQNNIGPFARLKIQSNVLESLLFSVKERI